MKKTPTPMPATTTRFSADASYDLAALDPAPAGDIVVELFYVEMDGCDPCASAIAEVDDAARLVRDELAAREHNLTVRAVPLHEPGHAQALGIDNPVTVRVAGRDVRLDGATGPFAACGVAGVVPRSCRSHAWNDQVFDAPPPLVALRSPPRRVSSSVRTIDPSSTSPRVRPTAWGSSPTLRAVDPCSDSPRLR